MVIAGWVDPDTDNAFQSITALTEGDDRQYKLVFSDEFNKDGRTFQDGDDPRWTALDKNDYTNDALHYYKSENVITGNGVLNITTNFQENKYVAFNEKTKKKYADSKYIQSGMVQGWNKFCFTGGIVEVKAKLPGKHDVGGLWPALWLLGNLARATYVGSSDYMWPWSYDICSASTRLSQEINACSAVNHYGLNPYDGRGAPEIDILEAMGGPPGKLPNTHIQTPYISTSLQVAPGVTKHRPQLGERPVTGLWYDGLEYGNVTDSDLNPFFYGVTLEHDPDDYTYQADALSANMRLNRTHFEEQHIYRIEWEPANEDGTGGYIRWFVDGEFVYGIRSEVLSLTGAHIPDEPMYLLLNTAVSSNWGFPKPCPGDCDCKCYECGNPHCDCGLPIGFCENIPASLEIDYVRVYQAEGESNHELGCSTERRPTKLFIEGHKERYMNEGDKDMLQRIQNGGGQCLSNETCGGEKQGTCLQKKKQCVCEEGFTGPFCLAYEGSYDQSLDNDMKLEVNSVSFPVSFYLLLGILFVGLSIACLSNVAKKRRQEEAFHKRLTYLGIPSSAYESDDPSYKFQSYQSIPTGQPIDDQRDNQNSNSPNKWDSNVVSYSIIDNRLIDK